LHALTPRLQEFVRLSAWSTQQADMLNLAQQLCTPSELVSVYVEEQVLGKIFEMPDDVFDEGDFGSWHTYNLQHFS
jgi:hypothetical protein